MYAFENLKLAQESQLRKRIFNFIGKNKLRFKFSHMIDVFFIYKLYLINNFLYFITLCMFIIKLFMYFKNSWHDETCLSLPLKISLLTVPRWCFFLDPFCFLCFVFVMISCLFIYVS